MTKNSGYVLRFNLTFSILFPIRGKTNKASEFSEEFISETYTLELWEPSKKLTFLADMSAKAFSPQPPRA